MILRRVNITGIGPVTPAGTGHEGFLRGMLECKPRAVSRRLRETNAGREVTAAIVADFRVGAYAIDAAHLDSPRHVQMALAATVLALRHAGITLTEARQRKPLVVVASPAAERGQIGRGSDGSVKIGLTQEAVARWLGGTVPKDTIFTSGLSAIGHAAMLIGRGECDIAICGGADVPFQPAILEEMKNLGLSPTQADNPRWHCRPFDLWRSTGVAAEGGCMVILEAENGRRPALAKIAGAAHADEDSRDPWSRFGATMRLALGNARLRPKDIDCVYADGVGQRGLDRAEAAALRGALGSQLDSIPVAAIQGAIGNALGGAGAIQLGCAALAMKHSLIVPTVNWRYPDPSCPLNLSPTARQMGSRVTMVSSRDARGSVACVLLTS